ncbi:MAG: hypothetical protein J5926_03310 [Ruminococcus sp.]|nr:hypothetical protein [Ruminococcus sp.]
MRERLNTGIFLGMIGNILFIGFGLVCMLYYKTYDPLSVFSKLLEGLAYITEVAGFGTLAFSAYLIIQSARMRRQMKIAYPIYIVFEAIMMVLELNSFHFSFYAPYSLGLAIFHSVASAAACFAFIQFDPENHKYEALIIICIGLIFGGMLGNIMGIRIYFSILVNAFSFSLLFAGIRFLTKREEIDIDVYGDRATVSEYSSDFFKDK